jgi:NADH-quinone oxidoreductase subunit E
MSHFHPDIRQRAEEVLALYPGRVRRCCPCCTSPKNKTATSVKRASTRSRNLTGTTSADVRGTAAFYDMFHLEPVGKYVVGVCTNIACLLAGGEEFSSTPARNSVAPWVDVERRLFTLEETECLADCDFKAPVRAGEPPLRAHDHPATFDAFVDELRDGKLDARRSFARHVDPRASQRRSRARARSREQRASALPRRAQRARGGEVMATLDAPRIVSSRAQYADSHTLSRYLATGGYVGLRKALTMFPEAVASRGRRRRHCSVAAARDFPRGASGRCCASHPSRISS